MDIAPVDLLKRLAAGIRPDGAAREARSASLEAMDFAGLLNSVRAGELASGRPVHPAPDLNVELTDDQLERLAVAADAAEAAGSERPVALIDGMVVAIDVTDRRITTAAAPAEAGVLTGVDGFVVVPEGRATELRAMFAKQSDRAARSAGGERQTQPGLDAIRNASIASILESISGADRAA